MKVFPLLRPPLLKEYRKCRATGIALNSKITDDYITGDLTEEAGEFLGVYVGDTLVFDDENEMSVLNDFILHEWRDDDGRNIVSRAAEEYGCTATWMQRRVLSAMSNAFTALVAIESTCPEEGTVRLQDIVNPGRTYLLVDIGCSMSATPEAVIFVRLFPFERFHTTSGVMFVLPESARNAATRRYRRVSERYEDDASPYLWREFLHFNRKRGVDVIMQ
ncbi:MAG: hypothetical protein ABIA92_01690 [Patescibacteria group bacterium]